jgi:O-antigen/teichoic acid export membrane protein
MATGLTFQVDKLIIGSRLGVADVTAYALVGRLFLIVHAGTMLVQLPLWPAYGEAIRRGDVAWARRVLRLMLAVSVASMVAWGALLFFGGKPIVRFMAHGEDVAVPRGLIVAVAAFFVMRVWAECHSVPLNAAGVIKPQVRVLLSNGVLNVVVALALVKPFGVLGVAWAFPITALLTSVWAYPALVRRHLNAQDHSERGSGIDVARATEAAA